MGKSIRSKSKLRAKSVKRKVEFSEFVAKRDNRISDKLVELTKAQDEAKKQKKEAEGEVDEPMDTDNTDTKKPSTSGWRNSRKQQYIQKNLKTKKKGKNATMKF